MLSFTLHTLLNKINTPKVSDLPTPRVIKTRPITSIWEALAVDINSYIGWAVRQFSEDGKTLHLTLDNVYGVHLNDRLERVIGILHRSAPIAIEEFSLVFIEQGKPMTQRIIKREAWIKKSIEFPPINDSFQVSQAIYATEPQNPKEIIPLWMPPNESRFSYSIVPSFQQNVVNPESFVLFKAGISSPFKLKLSENTLITGSLYANLIDNYGKYKHTGSSALPQVRTFVRKYSTTAQVYLPNLQMTHLGKLSSDQYSSVYGGYLESMFAGVGGEWLYRPWHNPFAFGIDLNQVQQRSFEQEFSFNNASTQTGYQVTTGHAKLYWDTEATFDISRSFDNGVSIDGYLTKKNVSAAQFGEGSFNKVLYLNIPFDVMTTSRTAGVTTLSYNPLSRDGGNQLNRSINLYDSTNLRSKVQTNYSPAEIVSPRPY